MRVLGISGSLRRDSHNTRLLRGAASLLPAGYALCVSPPPHAIPPFNEDGEQDLPRAVAELKAAIAAADAVLIATPEYNGSIPGQLKNALDWASRPVATNPLRGKPVAVVGASTSLFGAVWAQAELRKVLSTIGARPIEEELPVAGAHEALAADGLPDDAQLRAQMGSMLEQLLAASQPEPLGGLAPSSADRRRPGAGGRPAVCPFGRGQRRRLNQAPPLVRRLRPGAGPQPA
jgi:chromate reductase